MIYKVYDEDFQYLKSISSPDFLSVIACLENQSCIGNYYVTTENHSIRRLSLPMKDRLKIE